MLITIFVSVLPACLYSEAGVFLSRERAGVAVEATGLPGDGTETNSQENYNTDRNNDAVNRYKAYILAATSITKT